jgi:ankyrin repeat protein
MVEALLAKGANTGAKNAALVAAAGEGHRYIVRVLLAAGAQTNAHDEDGRTALMRAAGRGDNLMIHMLLAAGADANSVDRFGDSPLTYALRSDVPYFKSHPSSACYLLARGVEVDVKTAGGITPLQGARMFSFLAGLLRKAGARN